MAYIGSIISFIGRKNEAHARGDSLSSRLLLLLRIKVKHEENDCSLDFPTVLLYFHAYVCHFSMKRNFLISKYFLIECNHRANGNKMVYFIHWQTTRSTPFSFHYRSVPRRETAFLVAISWCSGTQCTFSNSVTGSLQKLSLTYF